MQQTSPTTQSSELVGRLRMWPAAEQGDALSSSYVGSLMRRAADLIESQAGAVEALREALEEAMRRYPDARAGLAWFAAASGLAAGEITQEVRDWADAALRQGERQ